MPPFKRMLRPGYGIGPGSFRPKDFLMPSAYQIPDARTAAPAGGMQQTPQVKDGAMMMCSCVTTPASLRVLPPFHPANIKDAFPLTNISPFGMCFSMSNPAVVGATAAALGVVTSQPCMPMTQVWSGGATDNLVNGSPALTPSSTCRCSSGGLITITWPGQ